MHTSLPLIGKLKNKEECHISRPLPRLTPPVTRTPRGLVSTICLCNYMSEYECMYMYTAVLLPQVYTIYIVYNVRIYVHYLVRIRIKNKE